MMVPVDRICMYASPAQQNERGKEKLKRRKEDEDVCIFLEQDGLNKMRFQTVEFRAFSQRR